MSYYATNIFTGERSPTFFYETEMDEYLNRYDTDAAPARFDVYHDGRLEYYHWNTAYYKTYMSDAYWICEHYNQNNIVIEQRNKHKRWM